MEIFGTLLHDLAVGYPSGTDQTLEAPLVSSPELTTTAPTAAVFPRAVARCEYCSDVVDDGGSFCSDTHAAAWLENPFA